MPDCIICLCDDATVFCESCNETIVCAGCKDLFIEENNNTCTNCGLSFVDVKRAINSNPVFRRYLDDACRAAREDGERDGHRHATQEAAAVSTHLRSAMDAFNEIQSFVHNSCPSCNVAFEYDGCNAITCRCGQRFCAVCISPCNSSEETHECANRCARELGLTDGVFANIDFIPAKAFRENMEVVLSRLSMEVRDEVAFMLSRSDLTVSGRTDGEWIADLRQRAKSTLKLARKSICDGKVGTYVPRGYRLAWCKKIQLQKYFDEPDDAYADEHQFRRVGWCTMTSDDDIPASAHDLLELKSICMRTDTNEVLQMSLKDEKICVSHVDRDGNIVSTNYYEIAHHREDENIATEILSEATRVLDISRELDLYDLSSLVRKMPLPIRHLLGVSKVQWVDLACVTTDVDGEVLNMQQAKVADLTHLMTATKVQGPPGTGKTMVITALLRQIAKTPLKVMLVSERNCAVAAVATHLRRLCETGGNIHDLELWEKIDAAGRGCSGDTLFFMDKIKRHPNVIQKQMEIDEILQNITDNKQHTLDAIPRKHLKIAKCIVEFCKKPTPQNARNLSKILNIGNINCPEGIGREDAHHMIQSVIAEPGAKMVVETIVHTRSEFIPACHDIIALQEAEPMDIYMHLNTLEQRLKDDGGIMKQLISNTNNLMDQYKHANVQKEDTIKSVTMHLHNVRQIGMSTVTSSSKLNIRPDILVIDEAGTMLTEDILRFCPYRLKAIIVLGDSNQIGPYAPLNDDVRSLMSDASISQICLSEQYRIPQRVASVLNTLVYQGQYRTVHGYGFGKGIRFINSDHEKTSRYSNEHQVSMIVNDVKIWLQKHPKQNGIILTPYREQLRALSSAVDQDSIIKDARNRGFIRICTINGAQGYEAHTVWFSLVNPWPTRFLTSNLLVVAITRATCDTNIYTTKSITRKWAKQTDTTAAKIIEDFL